MSQAPTAASAPPTVAPRPPRVYYGWWIVAGAMVAQFVAVGLQAQVSGVFLGPMTDELGWTRAEFTLATSIGTVFMGLIGFFVGALVDRRGARPLMLTGITIVGAALMAISRVEELWQFILLRGLVFTAGNVMIGNLVVNVTVSKWFVDRRGRAISMASLGVSAAGFVVPVVMTQVVDTIGWRDAWGVMGVAAWALVYPVAMIMRRQPEDFGLLPDGRVAGEAASESDRRSIERARLELANSYTRREALRTEALWLLIFGFGAAGIGIMALFFHFIPFLTDAGFTRTQASLLVGTQGVAALLSKFAWGWAMQRFFPRGLTAFSFLLAAAATVGIVIGSHAGALAPMYALFFVWGWAVGGMIPLSELIWASYFGRRHLGAVRGVAMPFTIIFFAGGPIFAGGYYDLIGTYDGALFTFAGLWVVGALLILLARQPAPRKAGAAAAPALPASPPAPPHPTQARPVAPRPPDPAPQPVASTNGGTPLTARRGDRSPARRADRSYMGKAKAASASGRDYMRIALPPGREPPPPPRAGEAPPARPSSPAGGGAASGPAPDAAITPREAVAIPRAPEPPRPTPRGEASTAPPRQTREQRADGPQREPLAGAAANENSGPPAAPAAPASEAARRAVARWRREIATEPAFSLGQARRVIERRLPLAIARYRRDGTASAVAVGVTASVVATATLWLLTRNGSRSGSPNGSERRGA